MPASFFVRGPFQVPRESFRNGRLIKPGCAEFWDTPETKDISTECGCYLFGIRAGRGIRPIYIGKATKTFKQECFSHHKIASHYTPALLDCTKGTPVMFFVVLKRTKGQVSKSAIASVERFLIENAVKRNPDLSNIKGRREEDWAIEGLIRKRHGKASNAAKQFARTMGL